MYTSIERRKEEKKKRTNWPKSTIKMTKIWNEIDRNKKTNFLEQFAISIIKRDKWMLCLAMRNLEFVMLRLTLFFFN